MHKIAFGALSLLAIVWSKLVSVNSCPHTSQQMHSKDSSSCYYSFFLTFFSTILPRMSVEIILVTFFLHCGQLFSTVSTHWVMHAPQYLWLHESNLTSFEISMSSRHIAHVFKVDTFELSPDSESTMQRRFLPLRN